MTDIIFQSLLWMGRDIMSAACYLPTGIRCGCVYLLLAFILYKAGVHVDGILSKENYGKMFLCVVYISTLLDLAFFSRPSGSRTGISLKLFETWGNSARAHAFFIENILLFIPFGILLPCTIKAFQKSKVCVFIGFLFSVCLEGAQFITGRGFCQLDDVITNTVGVIVGFVLFQAKNRIKLTDLEIPSK